MKYIIFKKGEMEFPILFSDFVEHVTIAQSLKNTFKITSAGFCNIKNNEIDCFGGSTTLKMKPAVDDNLLIEQLLGIGKWKNLWKGNLT